MKKNLFIAAVAAILVILMSVCAMAEYVPCTDPNGQHDMSEWVLKETFADGNTLSERVCSKCGYVQKGFSHVGDVDNAHMAVTLSLEADLAPAYNPATGAVA